MSFELWLDIIQSFVILVLLGCIHWQGRRLRKAHQDYEACYYVKRGYYHILILGQHASQVAAKLQVYMRYHKKDAPKGWKDEL